MMKDHWRDWLNERVPPITRAAIVEVGSTAHGTAEEGHDDLDLAVVWIEPMHKILSLDTPKQRQMIRTAAEGVRSGPEDIDVQLQTMRSWVTLAAKGNPSILQMLWCPIHETSPEWEHVRAHSRAFIGLHLLNPYRGYMKSQVERLVGRRGGGHGKRGSGGRQELVDKYGYDTKFAMHATRLGLQCRELLSTGGLELPMENEDGDYLRAIRHGMVPFQEWFDHVINLDAELGARRWHVPDGPDVQTINRLLLETHRPTLVDVGLALGAEERAGGS